MEDNRAAIIVAPGFMGNPDHWCFWDEEFPEDGSYGPFNSKEEALADVKAFCSWEDVSPPVKVLDKSNSPRLMRGNGLKVVKGELIRQYPKNNGV